ncbi:PTS sugar transporter subunit IIA [Geomonas nitrogeniifigens]|uniref:PTS sugar transporter subunit IIA n=1 Tax=Geomonas diazotrophica TaxID=2843197 RepID=A0ABX8JIU8_9BACT|nr:PTS sugar transporter subunit IIA [Geomonas nitrogeniifigens]QWV97881.1 PTS sugar transporter subunit IIA [Geomonas nitrogeniifigens]QXE87021.1 PTS sugar transporter subunit IIA [Geomonas nitrogeniifigens]
MDSLLDALQEGRLLEIPDDYDKEDALRFLAHILEAVPSLPPDTDVAGLILAKEGASKTALGKGWACPDARVPFDEDLICVVGWSPRGIDYGSPDGKAVKVIAMYLVPENQRSNYLREVSLLAKALEIYPEIERLNAADSLNDIRDHLLDLISTTKGTVGPDSRARMIRLQGKVAAVEPAPYDLANLIVEPITIIVGTGLKTVVLGHDHALVELLEGLPGLSDEVTTHSSFNTGGWRIVKRKEASFTGERLLVDCLALRTQGGK